MNQEDYYDPNEKNEIKYIYLETATELQLARRKLQLFQNFFTFIDTPQQTTGLSQRGVMLFFPYLFHFIHHF